MKRAPWLADALRGAGLQVVEHPGWQSRGRDFIDLDSVLWHHDASPPGDSPGVPAFMLREMAAGRAGAQLWVDRRGVWHVLAAGVAFHAGKVLRGMPGNYSSLGVETDHTTGEAWPQQQLDSLRAGTGAILLRLGRDGGGLHFHSTVCDPPGRKVDPDGLSLPAERARITNRITTQAASGTPTVQEDDVARLIKSPDKDETYGTDGTTKWYVPKPSILADLVRAGIYGDGTVHVVGQETVDALPLVEVRQ